MADDVPSIPELDESIKDLREKNIPFAVGMGESGDEMVARGMSIDEARNKLANLAAGEDTQEGNAVRNTAVHKSVTQYDQGSGRYRVYSLVIWRDENKDISQNL
jgi:hypothetical protein